MACKKILVNVGSMGKDGKIGIKLKNIEVRISVNIINYTRKGKRKFILLPTIIPQDLYKYVTDNESGFVWNGKKDGLFII